MSVDNETSQVYCDSSVEGKRRVKAEDLSLVLHDQRTTGGDRAELTCA